MILVKGLKPLANPTRLRAGTTSFRVHVAP
jgi:hypothetical protein